MTGMLGIIRAGSSPHGQRIRAAGEAFQRRQNTPVAPPRPSWRPNAEPRAALSPVEIRALAPAEKAAAALEALTPPTSLLTQAMVATAAYYGLRLDALRTHSGSRALALKRQVAMYLAREFGFSFPAIGRAFGGRDHTTILYGHDKIAQLLGSGDPDITTAVDDIRLAISSAGRRTVTDGAMVSP